jgi:hypothetical protein
MEFNASVLTAIAAMTGIVLGTFLSPFLNHQLTLKYNRRDFMFKKKLEYFEQVASCLEENIKMYKKFVKEVSSSENEKKDGKILKKIKEGRKKFRIMPSHLYFNVKIISKKIKNFVETEKKIFSSFERLEETKDEQEIEAIKNNLGESLKNLTLFGNEIIIEMRKELAK